MAIDKFVKTRGIIIKEQRYKESSKILTLFSEKRGKLNIFASGVLRPSSGLLMATEKFVESNFVLNLNKNRFYINKGEVINSNVEIASSLKRYFTADIICEILDKTMPENLVDEGVYNLTSETFKNLKNKNIDPDILRIGFMIKFISIIGFKPILDSCTDCGTKDYNNMYFSYRDGGIICGNCLRNNENCVKIDRRELEYIIRLLYSKLSDYEMFEIPEDKLSKIGNIILNYLLYNTELTELKSQKKLENFPGI